MIPTKMRSNSAMRIHRYFGALVRAICEPEFRFCSGGLGPVRAAEDNIRVNRLIELFGGRRYKTYRIYDRSL